MRRAEFVIHALGVRKVKVKQSLGPGYLSVRRFGPGYLRITPKLTYSWLYGSGEASNVP